MATPTIFLLSPANSGGKRAAMLVRPDAAFELAVRFRGGGAPLGETFSFLSGLYFRGKMAYASRFAAVDPPLPGVLVITPCSGLLDVRTRIGPPELEAFSRTRVDPREPGYLEPLRTDARELADSLPPGARVVLLGSVATSRYLDPLLPSLRGRLFFPEPFLGMGDMQRGSLMLRAAASGEELPYVPAERALAGRGRGRAAPLLRIEPAGGDQP
jgi:hypothetical protein